MDAPPATLDMSQDPSILMWAEACRLLDRAERLHRQFFRPGEASGAFAWEPPIDVFETETEILVEIALPGVPREQIEIVFDGRTLVVTGEKQLTIGSKPARIHRLEMPHGRFGRRLALARGPVEVVGSELTNGCLLITFRKLG
jgi:HSP20 family protein